MDVSYSQHGEEELIWIEQALEIGGTPFKARASIALEWRILVGRE